MVEARARDVEAPRADERATHFLLYLCEQTFVGEVQWPEKSPMHAVATVGCDACAACPPLDGQSVTSESQLWS